MESWWAEIDDAVLSCLAQSDTMTTKEIARRIGMSDEATRSVLALLAFPDAFAQRGVERPDRLRARVLANRDGRAQGRPRPRIQLPRILAGREVHDLEREHTPVELDLAQSS